MVFYQSIRFLKIIMPIYGWQHKMQGYSDTIVFMIISIVSLTIRKTLMAFNTIITSIAFFRIKKTTFGWEQTEELIFLILIKIIFNLYTTKITMPLFQRTRY